MDTEEQRVVNNEFPENVEDGDSGAYMTPEGGKNYLYPINCP